MIIGSWNNNIALGTYKIFIPKQVITTGIAEPGKKKTDKIVPQIINVTHAAMQNYLYKDIKIIYMLIPLLVEHKEL
jgi:hypothetical protein